MVTIETDRLRIRNFAADDWRGLQDMIVHYQSSDSARYEPPWPTSDEEIQSIAGWFAGADDYLCVALRETGAIIGFVAVERRGEAEPGVHNLGYVFHPAHQGHGYAAEACRAAMAYLFDQAGAAAIHTGTNPANQPSVRLLTRLGLRRIADGEFALSREEWLARAE